VGDEVGVRERRAGGHHLRARDDEPVVGLVLDVHADVGDLVGRQVAVDRRVDDRVVEVQDALLGVAVPAARVVLERRVEVRVGAERAEERGLVVGRAAHPAVDEALPGGDRVARLDELLGARGRPEERVRPPAVAGVGGHAQDAFGLGRVERVVERGDRARPVAERRVGRDVGDALAVHVDLAAVAQ
jgi:hypothetical protein